MKRIRKNLKKRFGRAVLALLLVAALAFGGITTAYATEEDAVDYDPTYGLYGGYDGVDSMNDPNTAGACVGWDIATRSAIPSESNLWWIDDYYIGENSQYDTEKTDDFSLKYQVEFHASEDLEAEAVQIVIDASLGTYRDGTNILPTDIGIPYGTPDSYTASSSSPFDYYYIDANGSILTEAEEKTADGVRLVVWNYKDIVSGSNAMFQVLYKDLDIMQIIDQTEWNLGVSVAVDIRIKDEDGNTIETRTETVTGNTLHGKAAYFGDLGYQGDVYRITETPDDDFAQIYPTENSPFVETLGSDGASVRFINGSFENVVSLTKELNGLDESGELYASLVKSDNTAQTLADGAYTVDVTFGVYDGDACVTSAAGALVEYDSSDARYPYVYIKVTADGSYTIMSYNGGVMAEALAPYDTLYIAEIGEYTVKASESEEMERVLLDVSGDISAAIGTESILSEGGVMSGAATANGKIVLVNNISSSHNASEIYKLMTEDSEIVPAGSEITFRLEIYNGETWSPARGIKYITFDGYMGGYDTTDCMVTSGVLKTGSDGRIVLVAGENGYPYIRFTEDTVYANILDDDAEAGDIRIVESSMADAWGRLMGYESADWENGPALNISYADTFVNANDDGLEFEVEKELGNDADAKAGFTFYVMQVLSAVNSPITSMDEITEATAGKGLYYIVYDVKTDDMISDGYTDANGSFTIQAGQYARIYAPKDTTWYVYEGLNPGFPFYSAKANDDPAGDGRWGYAENASIVDRVNGVVQETTEAKRKPATAFAIYSADDSSLTFYTDRMLPEEGDDYNGKTVTNLYTGFDSSTWTSTSEMVWSAQRTKTKAVVIEESFAEAKPVSLAYWFNGFTNATFTGLENIDTGGVTSMAYTFYHCSGLTSGDGLAEWDVSNVTTLYSTFRNCTDLINMDLSKWNTAKVTDMRDMFYSCLELTTIYSDDDVFVTTSVTDGSDMFCDCMELIGGNGTAYSVSDCGSAMAHVDTAANPGYFTDIAKKP